jgi:enoyl-CoA hydratase/carnithine racemase
VSNVRADLSLPHPGVAQILLDSGPMNFQTWTLMERLEESLVAARDQEARVVVIGSAVDGYFQAHGHIGNVVATFSGKEVDGDPMAGVRVQKELDTGPMVSIAAIDGQAWGGGAELAWSCDLRVASADATLGQPEVMIAASPAGGAARIAHLAGEATAKRIVLDGRPVGGAEAHRLGLVHRLTPSGGAVPEALEWAKWLAGRPPGALATAKRAVVGARGLALRDALRAETAMFVERLSTSEIQVLALEVQTRYDEGADSYAAFKLPRD